MKKSFRRIGLFGRFVLALVPMLVVVMAGIGVGGGENLALVIRVSVILSSLVVIFLLIRFMQGEDS